MQADEDEESISSEYDKLQIYSAQESYDEGVSIYSLEDSESDTKINPNIIDSFYLNEQRYGAPKNSPSSSSVTIEKKELV